MARTQSKSCSGDRWPGERDLCITTQLGSGLGLPALNRDVGCDCRLTKLRNLVRANIQQRSLRRRHPTCQSPQLSQSFDRCKIDLPWLTAVFWSLSIQTPRSWFGPQCSQFSCYKRWKLFCMHLEDLWLATPRFLVPVIALRLRFSPDSQIPASPTLHSFLSYRPHASSVETATIPHPPRVTGSSWITLCPPHTIHF